jgi:hypothetical protein
MSTLRERRRKFVGHIFGHSSLFKAVSEGEIAGKSHRERPRKDIMGK